MRPIITKGNDTFQLRPLEDESTLLVEKNGATHALVQFDGLAPVATPGVQGGAERLDHQIINAVLLGL